MLGKKVGRQPSHLVTRGTSGARRTNGTSQTTDAIFARSTISTFGTSIALKRRESLRLPVWGKEVTYGILFVSALPPRVPRTQGLSGERCLCGDSGELRLRSSCFV